MTTKTLIAAAFSAVILAPLPALAADDNDATMWPDKAKPTTQTAQQKARVTPRADEAMSGTAAAARGSTRPVYDPPVRPSAAGRIRADGTPERGNSRDAAAASGK
jgi:hypothetical protein